MGNNLSGSQMRNLLDNWTCPKCGDRRVEEVMLNVTVSSLLSHVHPDCTDMEYGTQINDGGETDRYQCASCGHFIAETPEALINALDGKVKE